MGANGRKTLLVTAHHSRHHHRHITVLLSLKIFGVEGWQSYNAMNGLY